MACASCIHQSQLVVACLGRCTSFNITALTYSPGNAGFVQQRLCPLHCACCLEIQPYPAAGACQCAPGIRGHSRAAARGLKRSRVTQVHAGCVRGRNGRVHRERTYMQPLCIFYLVVNALQDIVVHSSECTTCVPIAPKAA